MLKNNSLPTPAEQANNFITYLGDQLSSPGDAYEVFARQTSQENIYGLLGIKTGTSEWKDLQFIIKALDEQNILDLVRSSPTDAGQKFTTTVSLTLTGWQKYEELQRSVKDSRKAFVAMEFPSPERPKENYFFQTTLLEQYLIPAAKKAGSSSRRHSTIRRASPA